MVINGKRVCDRCGKPIKNNKLLCDECDKWLDEHYAIPCWKCKHNDLVEHNCVCKLKAEHNDNVCLANYSE